MNLRGVIAPYTGKINPRILGQIFISQGATTQPNAKRIPNYADPITLLMQVQALQIRDLTQLDGLNMSGSTHKIYVNGYLSALVRADNKGGDLIKPLAGIHVGRTFLTTSVLEDWPDWSCVSVTLQNV